MGVEQTESARVERRRVERPGVVGRHVANLDHLRDNEAVRPGQPCSDRHFRAAIPRNVDRDDARRKPAAGGIASGAYNDLRAVNGNGTVVADRYPDDRPIGPRYLDTDVCRGDRQVGIDDTSRRTSDI